MSRTRKINGGGTIQSVTRALSLLELLAKETSTITLSELSHKANLKMATVHRLLTTLMNRGFVEQDSLTLRYRLGIKVFEIGNAALLLNDLRSISRPFLKQLSDQVNETINLAVLDGTEVVYIDQLESTNMVIVKMFARVGSRGPAYCTGTGKVLLADLTVDELRKRYTGVEFIKFTDSTITDIDRLIETLLKIKKEGYALDFSERDPGVICIAAPIYNFEGRVQAAISVSTPAQRISEERIEKEILPSLLSISRQISQKLGYHSGN
jgi:DNA-binding IclR family transcriptional regulator